MIIGIDDTDDAAGGCTTALVGPVLRALRGIAAPAGPPRLVRCNPAIPWKTRGNAAVAIPIQSCTAADDGPLVHAGAFGAMRAGRVGVEPSEPDPTRVAERVWPVVRAHARPGSGPAVVVVPGHEPDDAWYRQGVQSLISAEDATRWAERRGAAVRAAGRGVVGATVAAAWPGSSGTWEALAYRHPAAIGSRRRLDAGGFAAIDRGPVFDAWCSWKGQPVGMPHTPCPILAGVRATTSAAAVESLLQLGPEPRAAWTLFWTNQATDDHLVPGSTAPMTSTTFEVTVTGPVRTVGRHAFAPGEPADVVAYEPTGPLRQALLRCRPGDRVVACGTTRLRDGRTQVNLEKACLPTRPRGEPCPACGGRRSSGGRHLRVCSRCGLRGPAERAWVEAATSARRHLSRPLRLSPSPRTGPAAPSQIALAPHS